MTMVKATAAPPPALVQAVVQSVWNVTQEDATYTINFGGKSQRSVTAPSALGARELYNQCASRGFAYPFEMVKATDQIVADIWITDVTWKARDVNTGQEWTFATRGAEPYNPRLDTLAVANRRAFGKAERNACLRCVPHPVLKGFLALLANKTGLPAMEPSDPASETIQPSRPQQQFQATLGGELTHQDVYQLARELGFLPQKVPYILGSSDDPVTLPKFIEVGGTHQEAMAKIADYAEAVKQGGAPREPEAQGRFRAEI
jgi:hypothetical protein